MVQTDKVLEFDKIKKKWMELALTEWAKEKIKDIVPCMLENKLMAKERERSVVRELLEKNEKFKMEYGDTFARICVAPFVSK